MVEMIYVDEATFKKEIVAIGLKQFKLSYDILNKCRESAVCSELIVRKDKSSLCFCVNLGDKDNDKEAYMRGDDLYRVVIEKI